MAAPSSPAPPSPDSSGGSPLDIRGIPPEERHALVFGAIGELRPREGVELLNDHYPAMLEARLEAGTPGAFRVIHLEAGPPTWRFRVERLRDGGPGSPPPVPAAPQAPA